jgi:hypothetical protein
VDEQFQGAEHSKIVKHDRPEFMRKRAQVLLGFIQNDSGGAQPIAVRRSQLLRHFFDRQMDGRQKLRCVVMQRMRDPPRLLLAYFIQSNERRIPP